MRREKLCRKRFRDKAGVLRLHHRPDICLLPFTSENLYLNHCIDEGLNVRWRPNDMPRRWPSRSFPVIWRYRRPWHLLARSSNRGSNSCGFWDIHDQSFSVSRALSVTPAGHTAAHWSWCVWLPTWSFFVQLLTNPIGLKKCSYHVIWSHLTPFHLNWVRCYWSQPWWTVSLHSARPTQFSVAATNRSALSLDEMRSYEMSDFERCSWCTVLFPARCIW